MRVQISSFNPNHSVAELADATDLKSSGIVPCEFDSHQSDQTKNSSVAKLADACDSKSHEIFLVSVQIRSELPYIYMGVAKR